MPAGEWRNSPERNAWRLDALDEWRKDLDGRVAVLESKVGDIVFDDKLAQELANRLKERNRYSFSLWQKLGAGLVSLVIVAGEVKSLFGL